MKHTTVWIVISFREEWVDGIEVARFSGRGAEVAAIDEMIAREKAYADCGLTFWVTKAGGA
jgi:hypothetical protein